MDGWVREHVGSGQLERGREVDVAPALGQAVGTVVEWLSRKCIWPNSSGALGHLSRHEPSCPPQLGLQMPCPSPALCPAGKLASAPAPGWRQGGLPGL